MTWAPPRVAALLLAGGTLIRMAVDPSWVGDWNETGSILGVYGIFGATLGGAALALHGRRNVAPLRTLHLRAPVPRVIRDLLVRAFGPSLLAWVLTSLVAYVVTFAVNPAPSAPSGLPLLVSTLGVLSTLTLGLLAGTVMPTALALPLVIAAGFLVPASLGAIEPSRAATFTVSTSTSLEVQFAPVASLYAAQAAFFGALSVGSILLLAVIVARARLIPAALAAIVLVGLASTAVATAPTERITDAAVTSSQRCAQESGVEVCLLSDHQRFLPAALSTAVRLHTALPPDATPKRYVEAGLHAEPGDVVLDPSGVRVDVLGEVVDASATWRLCEEPLGAERPLWLAHRAGLLDPLPDLDELKDVRDAPDADQIAWWTAPMSPTC